MSTSPASAMLSWLAMSGLAMGVAFVAMAWPESDDWEDALWDRMPTDPKPKSKPEPVATTEADGAGESGDDAGSDDEPGIDGPIPVIDVPNMPDPDSVIDELPAEGDGTRRGVERIDVGDGRIAAAHGEGDWVIHRVVPTETVAQIAYRYGVRPDALRMWNGIKAGEEKLKNGARLKLKPRKVPPPRRKYAYWIQPGDSWWSIGTTFGVDSRDLRTANRLAPQRPALGTTVDVWIDPVVYLWVSSETDPAVPASVRLGAVGIGPPQDGRLVNGVQLPTHDAYALKLPPSAYGTTHAVAHVVKAMDEFHGRSEYRRKLMMGSMSGKHGGPLTPHRSHQTGRDLDIRLPLLETVPEHWSINPKRVDWVALWHLIESFDVTGQVVIIFLDYDMQEYVYRAAAGIGVDEERRKQVLQWPRGNKANLGLVRHSPGHEAHIHVRMTCGPNEPECVSEADFDIDAD
ncbi:MAG: penicillin-insensitive murein endopeptidase [Deltaproteobacteria bacterium]|nr:penicillin-insensitive murein endopeptidase [Deltaproteobacteria bacterium]MBP7290845.1 penicillin-insensitive murein endopeptidase [Nannocystaceae bacterium]